MTPAQPGAGTPAAAPAKRPRKAAGNGQWALGHLEPLNPNERTKKDDDGLNVRARIENIYSKQGFDSIDPGDLRGRMRWYGLYTQRKPGIDGGKTGSLEPEELDDRYFMLRVRIDGGQLDLRQLREVAAISQEFGRDTADITDRQNVQYHWIEIEHVPEIFERLEAVGLWSVEACGDTPRIILGSPVAGVAEDELIDATPAIDEIKRRYIGSKKYSNLPRKFKTAITGSPRQDVVHEINDVSFVAVDHPELGVGFMPYVGGGLSTNPMIAQPLGVHVTLDEVPEVWEAIVSIFRDWGYRRLRHRARIKFLMADWGPEKFREMVESEDYLGRKLPDGVLPPKPEGRRDHVGVHRQKDGLSYVGFAPTVGRVSGTILAKVADLAEAAGSNRLRATVEQKMVILDVAEDKVDALVAGLEELGLYVAPSEFRRGTMACTGIEFCKLAIVETKGRAADLVGELESRLPTFDQPITINLNGCPNSCARTQTADLGFRGQLVVNDAGEQVEGYQISLGGSLSLGDTDAGFGRKVRGLKTTADELPDYVERVVRNYDQARQPGETFAQWVQRAEDSELS